MAAAAGFLVFCLICQGIVPRTSAALYGSEVLWNVNMTVRDADVHFLCEATFLRGLHPRSRAMTLRVQHEGRFVRCSPVKRGQAPAGTLS